MWIEMQIALSCFWIWVVNFIPYAYAHYAKDHLYLYEFNTNITE